MMGLAAAQPCWLHSGRSMSKVLQQTAKRLDAAVKQWRLVCQAGAVHCIATILIVSQTVQVLGLHRLRI